MCRDSTPPVFVVLDDEPQTRKTLRRLLASHGFFLEGYEHGDDSLPGGPTSALLSAISSAIAADNVAVK